MLNGMDELEVLNLASKLLERMTKERFHEWYTTRFESYIKGDAGAPTEKEILQDVVKHFRVEKLLKTPIDTP